jgi:alkylation response protein AidB-like acyl-CoA dehydrogenase
MESLYVQTENQRAIVETVRRFVEKEVTPRASALDAEQDPEKCYSWEIVEKAHELGIRTMTLDEKWGGLGTDPLTTAMVIEELNKGDLGVAITIGQTLKLAQIFQSGLNGEQKQRVLPRFAQDPRGMLAIGITEPDNGSNYLVPYAGPFRTVAVKTNGGWIVNGMKHFISNANRASVFRPDREGQADDVRLDLFPGRARPARLQHRPRARQDGRASHQQRRDDFPGLLHPG